MSPTQEKIICYLAARLGATLAETTKELSISPSTFNRLIYDLRDEGLVESTKAGHRNICAYLLTRDGRAAAEHLESYKPNEGEIVPPNRTNRMEGFYEPSTGYQRNNGRDLRIGVSV